MNSIFHQQDKAFTLRSGTVLRSKNNEGCFIVIESSTHSSMINILWTNKTFGEYRKASIIELIRDGLFKVVHG